MDIYIPRAKALIPAKGGMLYIIEIIVLLLGILLLNDEIHAEQAALALW